MPVPAALSRLMLGEARRLMTAQGGKKIMGCLKLLLRFVAIGLVVIVLQNPDILLAGIVICMFTGVSVIRWIIRHLL
jgi:hypothetical protein